MDAEAFEEIRSHLDNVVGRGAEVKGWRCLHPPRRSGAVLLAHDLSLLGWLITAAYFAAAFLTLRAARGSGDERDRMFWIGCSALLLLLGLNKQLDLQGYLTTAGRSLARQEGWFEYRRLVQAAFIVTLCIAAATTLAVLAAWLRRSATAVKVAALGIVLLFTFILWRAASFHHMDVWVTRDVAGMRSGWWLELAGVVTIGLSAIVYRSRSSASAEGTPG